MARVQLKNVVKRYGDIEVIDGLTLDIEDGSFTVLVGPSGCGKSTLLRMVAGLEPISAGDLFIDGKKANQMDPVERGIAMVFQNYALYPHMSVARNIGFSLRMAGYEKAEIVRRVEETAKTLKIEHLLDRKPANLSGGQRQRVAIGRAIVRDPQVFLFDEPLSNLDAELRVSMRVELARLHREIKATMLYVTHDQIEAMTLADKIVVMRDGKIEQQGTPKELYGNPENTFVAGFIGSPRMNFFDATVRDGRTVLSDGTELAVGAGLDQEEVVVGVRPEHLTIGESGSGCISVTADMVEYLGGTRYVYGRLSDGTSVVIEARGDNEIAAGSVVSASANPGKLMIFDRSGLRLRRQTALSS